MRRLFEQLERVARTDVSVLVRGETGTGKELVARALHRLSARSDGPFRAVNCATFTPEMLASELFGHVRGAFTGAVGARKGLFELANGGTLFLDEVAEIPLDLQARLLRVLQERSFIPVGGTHPVEVNVRVISATHRALRAEVAARRFRADLLYRIRVVPLYIPPLRDRGPDIKLLTQSILHEFSQRGGRRVDTLDKDAAVAFATHPWPGNVRELRNALECGYALGTGETISLADLPPEFRGEAPKDDGPQPQTEEGIRKRGVLDALRQSGGRKGEAAKILGVSRSTLWRMMREFGV
jgi:transcriptional regulator with PAS, ATPase and Fis domain